VNLLAERPGDDAAYRPMRDIRPPHNKQHDIIERTTMSLTTV
jgi:hypothetical protein